MQSDVMLAWTAYLLSVSTLLLLFYIACRFFNWHRYAAICCGLLAVLFLTPAQIEPGTSYWAPAWMAICLDAVSGQVGQVWGRIVPLVTVMLLLLGLSLLGRWRRAKGAEKSLNKASE